MMWRRLASSFDRLVMLFMLAVAALIGLTLVHGDQVGVQIARVAPTDQARRNSAVTLQFSEEMRRDSVGARFHLEPAVEGDLTWSGRMMIFRPNEALQAGGRYTVVLQAGAESESGRKLLADRRFGFAVLAQRIAYLAPVEGPVKNIWMVDPFDATTAQQITHSRSGILAFDVSLDGVRLAFAEGNRSGGSDLKVLELDTGDVRQVTSCGDNVCAALAWSPDGAQLAFERRGATSSAIPGVPRDTTRVWVLDPTGTPSKARPLLPDPQIPAHFEPRWSPTGDRIAVSQPVAAASAGGGVLVHTLTTGDSAFYRASGAGTFSPDGSRLLFPSRVTREGEVRTVLQSVALEPSGAESYELPELLVDPGQLDWRPGAVALTLTRRYVGAERSLGRQVYLARPAESALLPLVVDPAYDHAFFAWDPTGRFLAVERASVQAGSQSPDRDTRSQIWLYDAASGALARLATNAFQPRWVP